MDLSHGETLHGNSGSGAHESETPNKIVIPRNEVHVPYRSHLAFVDQDIIVENRYGRIDHSGIDAAVEDRGAPKEDGEPTRPCWQAP